MYGYLTRPIRFLTMIAAFAAFAGPVAADPLPRGWFVAATEHVEIVYSASTADEAAELASFAEEAYARVTGYFDSTPPGKIRVVLSDRSDFPDGYLSGFPRHVFISVNGVSGAENGLPDGNWLELVFTHELTHCVDLYHEDALATKLGTVFGPVISGFTAAGTPPWASEGITTNLETAFGSGGRGRSRFFELFYRAAILEQEYWRLDEASDSGPLATPDGRWYVSGYVFVAYLRNRFGSDVYARIERERHRSFLSFDAAVEKVTGFRADALYDDLRLELARRYADRLALPDGIRVTPRRTAAHYYPPAWIGDGSMILYRRVPDGLAAVVRYDEATGSETVLFEAAVPSFALSASADGTTLAYVAAEYDGSLGKDATIRGDLWRWRAPASSTQRAGAPERLTRSGGFAGVALSPDASRIVAVRVEGPGSRIVEVLPDGSYAPLFPPDGSGERVTVAEPSFSPDGKTVAFAIGGPRGMELGLLDLGTREVTRYAIPAAPVSSLFGVDPGDPSVDRAAVILPRFDADGSVLFGCDVDGSLAVYRYVPGSDEAILAVEDPVGAYCAVPSPEGLVYGSMSYRGWILKRPGTVAPERRVAVKETDGPAATRPAFAPPNGDRFLNAPVPALVTPYPNAIGTADRLEWGAGAAAVFASLPLASPEPDTMAFLAAGWFFAPAQPSFAASLVTRAGPFRLMAVAMRQPGYDADGFFALSEAAGGFIVLPLVETSRYPATRALSVGVGGSFARTTTDADSFPFMETPEDASVSTLGTVSALISFAYLKAGVPLSPLRSEQFTASLTFAAAPDADGIDGVSIVAGLVAAKTAGPFGFAADADWVWRTGGPRVVTPGLLGFGDSELGSPETFDAQGVAGVSFLAPLGGSALELRAETFAAHDGAWRIAPDLYLDAGLRVGLPESFLRFGVAFRVDPTLKRELGESDVAYYVSFRMPFGF